MEDLIVTLNTQKAILTRNLAADQSHIGGPPEHRLPPSRQVSTWRRLQVEEGPADLFWPKRLGRRASA